MLKRQGQVYAIYASLLKEGKRERLRCGGLIAEPYFTVQPCFWRIVEEEEEKYEELLAEICSPIFKKEERERGREEENGCKKIAAMYG